MTLAEYKALRPPFPAWDAEKNTLPADEVAPNSHRRAWWRCERGHSWRAAVFSVSEGTGCPYCAGRLPIAGETDLATTHPRLAAEWDAARNGTLAPADVSQGAVKKVWWRCERGHSYEARIFSRSAGAGCPYCAGRKTLAGFNDLASLRPAVAAEWDAARNGALTPADVTCGSHRKVWWRCQAGHVWQAAVYSRTRERAAGCPVCTGRVKPQKRAGRLAPPEQERTHQFEEVRI